MGRTCHICSIHRELEVTPGDLSDYTSLQQRLDRLAPAVGAVVAAHIRRFLKGHGCRRKMPSGLERTRYLLGALTDRPAYYIWLNPRSPQL